MPQLISSLIFGLTFVSENHAVNELGWLHTEDWVVNRRDLGIPSELIKSNSCSANQRPNPALIDRARLIARSCWNQKCRMRLALAGMIVVAAGSFINTAKADPHWCAISNKGTSNCSFATIEQCRAEVSGMGEFCMPEAPVGHRQPTRASIEGPARQPQDAEAGGRGAGLVLGRR
jgi:hypothetical protein